MYGYQNRKEVFKAGSEVLYLDSKTQALETVSDGLQHSVSGVGKVLQSADKFQVAPSLPTHKHHSYLVVHGTICYQKLPCAEAAQRKNR